MFWDVDDTGFEFTHRMDVGHDEERANALVRGFGCEHCDSFSVGGPHLCEHGVDLGPDLSVEFTVDLDVDEYRKLLGF